MYGKQANLFFPELLVSGTILLSQSTHPVTSRERSVSTESNTKAHNRLILISTGLNAVLEYNLNVDFLRV
jgi:hypothetical protein